MNAKVKRPLFGTDGIRGVANVEPMTSETAVRVGRALAVTLRNGARPKIVIGKDTRLSGYMLETALASGITSTGADVLLVGPLPTPAIAFLARTLRADAGVVISASHNPHQDNGIKIFSGDGFKLPDEVEARIEGLVTGDGLAELLAAPEDIGKASRIDDAGGRYNVFLKSIFPRHKTLEGLRIAFDGANGAGYRIGPEVLRELGAWVVPIGVEPDGTNINRECGALHPEHLAELVRQSECHAGIALDGDGDRVILVDEKGEILDGDDTLAILAVDRIERGVLPESTVVATVMSNMGLDRAIEERGGRVVRTRVGDRYVVEEMLTRGALLGGESSGHIVCLDHATTGDGLLTALAVLGVMIERGRPLSELRRAMERMPQVLENVPVREKRPFEELPGFAGRLREVEESLAGRGRVLVRYSGTEPVARIVVEGEDLERIQGLARSLREALEREIAGGVRRPVRAA